MGGGLEFFGELGVVTAASFASLVPIFLSISVFCLTLEYMSVYGERIGLRFEILSIDILGLENGTL